MQGARGRVVPWQVWLGEAAFSEGKIEEDADNESAWRYYRALLSKMEDSRPSREPSEREGARDGEGEREREKEAEVEGPPGGGAGQAPWGWVRGLQLCVKLLRSNKDCVQALSCLEHVLSRSQSLRGMERALAEALGEEEAEAEDAAEVVSASASASAGVEGSGNPDSTPLGGPREGWRGVGAQVCERLQQVDAMRWSYWQLRKAAYVV